MDTFEKVDEKKVNKELERANRREKNNVKEEPGRYAKNWQDHKANAKQNHVDENRARSDMLNELRALFSDLNLPINVQTDDLFWKGISKEGTKSEEGEKLVITLGLGEVTIFDIREQYKILLEADPSKKRLQREKVWVIIEWEERREDLISAKLIENETQANKLKSMLRDAKIKQDNADERKRGKKEK